MFRYISRRLVQTVFTVLGVMLLTFVLFRIIAGDVSSSYVNQKLGVEAKRSFNEKHKLDRPGVFNFHKRLELVDETTGDGTFSVRDSGSFRMAKSLGLHLAPYQPAAGAVSKDFLKIVGNPTFNLDPGTPLSKMVAGKPVAKKGTSSGKGDYSFLIVSLQDRSTFVIDVTDVSTCGELMARINQNAMGSGKCIARISAWRLRQLFDSQFFWHLYENVTFSGRSYATDQTVLDIIRERGKYSLSITVPPMALGWLLAMVISCLVAYYRGRLIDRLTVFLTVLGMCIPYLAYMLMGQWLMFKIAPKYAAGLANPMSVYVPIMISVIAGLGWSVRFYRVVILNEVNKDYVRTALAKGVPLGGVLFKHVLKNCMLPILTNVISEIPFLIMGALLLEKFFGIPGLGDLFLTSITSRDVPIITGLTYFTTILYVISLLVTDVLYAVFDPRIRLR